MVSRHRVAARLVCVLGAVPMLLANVPLVAAGQAVSSVGAPASGPATLIIRTDDVGMSHSVNMAVKRLIDSGLPLSVSVMFACPWYQESVEILKAHPAVSVGIHLTLNSEWKFYRWGPVAGREAVPTLVDSNGYFFQSGEALHQNHPDVREIEKELRSQIDRALRSGVKIDYVDYHMGTAVDYPEFREVVERLAQEYSLGMMGYFGDSSDAPQYFAAPARKADSLVAFVDRLQPGVMVLVTHVGIDDAELGALLDMNTADPLPEMSKNRQGELDALTSTRFTRALRARNIRLMTFRELIQSQGLKAMHRPVG
jgi:predicted glycoside hydrolase/deacetylase ChbG (UPF0249 family)